MQIFIKGSDGVQRNHNIEPTAMIKNLKDDVKDIYGIACERLAFGGKTLANDTQTLEDWGIKDMSTVVATLRLRGGQ